VTITALNVVGARPNFMKIAPITHAMKAAGIRPVLVHTGQHYDDNMSAIFLEEFGLGSPDVELGIGSGSHAEQTGRVMIALEPVIRDVAPDVVVVVGDVNSTLAASITAVKLGIPVAHVEAGLRSFDRTMPEEINRIVTDAISDILFAPSADGVENLKREGVADEKIHLVGNVMIDTLDALRPRVDASTIVRHLDLTPAGYVAVTLHRPANVDDESDLRTTAAVLAAAATAAPIVLVAHPRTRNRMAEVGVLSELERSGVRVIDPLGYVDFMALVASSGAVLTDSGGIQEETTVMGVPCVTMRTTTERPITITEGTNRLVAREPEAVEAAMRTALREERRSHRPDLWDGRAAVRIVNVLRASYSRATRRAPSG
jgi:UDP-N-acetylglucosamine 2-epimerase (non-hydrolysing)